MPNLESDVPHTLQCDLGTINFNTPDPATNRNYLIVPNDYRIVPASLRYTSDPLSQADGGVPHPAWKDGLIAGFSVAYVLGDHGEGGPACGLNLRVMDDLLSAFLDELRFPSPTGFDQQRLYWTPTGPDYGPGAGGNQRMLTNILTAAWPTPTEGVLGYQVPVEFASPFPYAIDSVQQLVSIADGGSTAIDNYGTADERPVVKAYGPFTSFGLTNTTTGAFLQYDGSRPGASSVAGGHYAEIDMFRGTVTLDGSVTFLDAGVDASTSDFFPLVKGSNVLEPVGADIDVLWNPAWS